MNDSQTPLGDWLVQCGGSAGLVFADIVDSTVLLFTRKTFGYRRMVRAYTSRARKLSTEFGGRLVDESGDELLAAFPSAGRACAFARELFRDPGIPDLHVRVGVHFGVVSAEGGALVGRNVHLGARVMQHGVGRELWFSDAAKSALEAESPSTTWSLSWIASDECELKGIPTRQRLWRAA